MSKLSPLPRFAPKALQLALAAGVLSLATAQGAMAQEKVLRIAMTAADIPLIGELFYLDRALSPFVELSK